MNIYCLKHKSFHIFSMRMVAVYKTGTLASGDCGPRLHVLKPSIGVPGVNLAAKLKPNFGNPQTISCYPEHELQVILW